MKKDENKEKLGKQEEESPKLNKKKVFVAVVVIIIIIIAGAIFLAYSLNRDFRNLLDKYVLMKNVTESSLNSIELEENANNYIYAYDKYIAVLNNGKLTHYNASGDEQYSQTIEIATPLVATNGKFILIADKDGQKIYLISGENQIWEKKLEGNISRVCVNKNGYVAVVLTGTINKSVIQVFDADGKDLFNNYLSSTIAMDVDISYDNKYVAYAEISTEGTLVQSRVKTISVEKAKDSSSKAEAIIYSYNAPMGSLITDIKYDEQNKIVCMYANESIHVIKDDKDEEILKLKEENQKINFGGIEINQNVYRIVEKSELFSTTNVVEIENINSKSTNIYIIDGTGTVRDVYSYGGTIAINLGSEVHFIATNGWLIKKYTSAQEIKDIVISDGFAGIIYRNKIEIINL